MTRIDFYILKDTANDAHFQFACKLTEKAYRLGHKVFIYTDSKADAHHVDELLWTYKTESFLPHNLQNEGPNAPPPIQISYKEDIKNQHDVFINLSTRIPEFFSRFNRVAEIAANHEEMRQTSRDHYKFYKDRGYPLQSHQLSV